MRKRYKNKKQKRDKLDQPITSRLNADDKLALRQLAKDMGVSQAEIMREALYGWYPKRFTGRTDSTVR